MAMTKQYYTALGAKDKIAGTTDNRPNYGWQLKAYNEGYSATLAYSRTGDLPAPADAPLVRPRPRTQRRVNDVFRRMEGLVAALQHKRRMAQVAQDNANLAKRRWG